MDTVSIRSRKPPAEYPSRPFHLIRTLYFLCSGVVLGIVLDFGIQLKVDKFKIPWTFLVMALVALLTEIAIVLTLLIHCCHRLSPLLNMVLNIPLLLGWVFSLGLLGWNLTGTLGHSCSIANWGNSTGVMVCNVYKLMFTFTLFSTLCAVAAAILDFRVRREQVYLGTYDRMDDHHRDVKLDTFESSTTALQPTPTETRPYGVDHDVIPDRRSDNSPYWHSRSNLTSPQYEYQDPIYPSHAASSSREYFPYSDRRY